MTSLNFEQNKKEAIENLTLDKRKKIMVNENNMGDDKNLALEYINLYSAFVYDIGESFPISKFDCFRALFLDLREAIESHMQEGEYDSETLKRIMVHLNLELGTDVNFIVTFKNMLLENTIQKGYSELQEDFTFNNLYQQYNLSNKKEKTQTFKR